MLSISILATRIYNIQASKQDPRESWILYLICTSCVLSPSSKDLVQIWNLDQGTKFIRTAINNFTLQIVQSSLEIIALHLWCGSIQLKSPWHLFLIKLSRTMLYTYLKTNNFGGISLDWKFTTDSVSHHSQKLNERENLRAKIDSLKSTIYREFCGKDNAHGFVFVSLKNCNVGRTTGKEKYLSKGCGLHSHSRFSSTHL